MSNKMNVYCVKVSATYDASYEGEIDTSFSKLVYANSETEAMDFVDKDLYKLRDNCRSATVKSALKIDFEKAKNKKKPGYYF